MPEDRKKLEFTLQDEIGGKPLSPTNVALPTLRGFLEDVEKLIKGDKSNANLADSQVLLEEGSLRVLTLVAAALASNLEFEMMKLSRTGDLDEIQASRAKVISEWQAKAQKSPARKYFIGTELAPYRVGVFPQSHYQHRSENAWIAVEKYLTGKVENAGGKQDPNIHLALRDSGETLRVFATKEQLGEQKENQLYKEVTLFVRAEQHILRRSLRNVHLIHFVKAADVVDRGVLEVLWAQGREAWRDVPSATDWVEELRGNP